MSQENTPQKIEYNNIEPVEIDGKTKWRIAYTGRDSKPKFLHSLHITNVNQTITQC